MGESHAICGREPDDSGEWLCSDLPAITAAFGACCTMAKCGSPERIELKRVGGSCQRIVWLPIAHLAALVASDIQMVNGKW